MLAIVTPSTKPSTELLSGTADGCHGVSRILPDQEPDEIKENKVRLRPVSKLDSTRN